MNWRLLGPLGEAGVTAMADISQKPWYVIRVAAGSVLCSIVDLVKRGIA